MDSNDGLVKLWEQSSSRSFYNAPEYAVFSLEQSNKVHYLRFGDDDNAVVLPYQRPVVWTYWRSTRLPIPPRFAPTQSIYFGLILPQTRVPLTDVVKELFRHRRRELLPDFTFVQPVLVDSGPADFLEELSESVAAAGLSTTDTASQILQIPTGANAPALIAASTLSFEQVRELPVYATLGASYAKKRRYDLRRAEQLGVRCTVDRIVSDEHATEVYSSVMDLHRESWTRTGLGPHTLKYWVDFSRMMRESGGHDIVTRAYSEDGELLSVVDVHVRGKSVFYQMNSSSLQGQKLGANPLALHTAIVTSGLWGAEYFELGRYSTDASEKARSVHAYKAEFGGDVLSVPNFTMSAFSR